MSDQEEMSFWDHLEEFRWMILRSLIALMVFAVAAFAVMPYIYDSIIMGPINSDFFLYRSLCTITSNIPFVPDFCDDSFHVEIININLASQFFRHMSTSVWVAIIFMFPYLMYEVWRFVNPALYAAEKNKTRKAFVFGTVMFFLGCGLGYAVIFPITFRFLSTYQLSPDIKNFISLDSYMDNFLMMILAMGLVFELPLVAWLSSKLGLLDRGFFRRYRRHAVVALLVLAAFITPSSDVFTLGIVFVPLYLLFELSYYLVEPVPVDDIEEDEVVID